MSNETTTILTGLSERGRAALIEFCRKHLREGLNATPFADALIAEGYYENEFAHFEIGGFHTKSGNPATIRFDKPEDLAFITVDEFGEPVRKRS